MPCGKRRQGDIEAHRAFMDSLLDAVQQNIAPAAKDVVLGGAQNIFNHPEYQDVSKAKNFLALLETKDTLYNMLSRATDMEFTIRIGRENEIDELADMSLVTATYRVGGKKAGLLWRHRPDAHGLCQNHLGSAVRQRQYERDYGILSYGRQEKLTGEGHEQKQAGRRTAKRAARRPGGEKAPEAEKKAAKAKHKKEDAEKEKLQKERDEYLSLLQRERRILKTISAATRQPFPIHIRMRPLMSRRSFCR